MKSLTAIRGWKWHLGATLHWLDRVPHPSCVLMEEASMAAGMHVTIYYLLL